MRITADTNVLLRAVLRDDHAQAARAERALDGADLVVVTTPTLCEFAWVLSRLYKRPPSEIATVIRGIVNGANVSTDRAAVDGGLAMLDAGGDFADGVIASVGQALGADIFLSFDRDAVRLLQARGVNAAEP